MNEMISAAENPALANELIQAAISMPQGGGDTEAVEPVEVSLPPSGEVKLLAGLYNSFTGELTTEAEVRELNGEDEEALSKIQDFGRGLLSILQRGTVRIGDEQATPDVLDSLLAGDREYLILQIRIASLGETIELEGECPHCASEEKFHVDLVNDLKPRYLEDPADRVFTVDCKIGEVTVELPNGVAQRKLMTSTDKTAAELDTFLLRECVTAVNGLPIMDTNQVKKLGLQDRRKILSEISNRNPGPRLGDLAKNCPACGQEVPIPLSLADLFRL